MIEVEEAETGFFPSIGQFRNAVKAERDWATYHNVEPRKRTYVGTVKLHGTNAGISLTPDGELIYRSRTRVITPMDDNSGFASHMVKYEDIIRRIFSQIPGNGEMLTLFGEWCGAGIQRGVGITNEPKLFAVFAVRIGDNWGDVALVGARPEARIFNILQFGQWKREIDFARPELVQNELGKLTEAVEAECPAAKSFGHSGIGEGIVWMPVDGDMRSRYWFKVKGEKHSASKVRTLAAVDTEQYRLRDELVSTLVTENRMEQGLALHVSEFGHAVEMKSISHFLRWVFNDIAKEDADTIVASGFEIKDLGKPISDIAKRFYLGKVNAV